MTGSRFLAVYATMLLALFGGAFAVSHWRDAREPAQLVTRAASSGEPRELRVATLPPMLRLDEMPADGVGLGSGAVASTADRIAGREVAAGTENDADGEILKRADDLAREASDEFTRWFERQEGGASVPNGSDGAPDPDQGPDTSVAIADNATSPDSDEILAGEAPEDADGLLDRARGLAERAGSQLTTIWRRLDDAGEAQPGGPGDGDNATQTELADAGDAAGSAPESVPEPPLMEPIAPPSQSEVMTLSDSADGKEFTASEIARENAAKRVAADHAAEERIRLAKLDAERLEAERLEEQRRVAEERALQEAAEEQARLARAQEARDAAVKAKRKRIARLARLKAERVAAERRAAEARAAEQAAKEERIRLARLEAERLEAERVAAERLAAEQRAAEQRAAEERAAARAAEERRVRLAEARKARAAKKAREEAAKAQRIHLARLEAERIAAERRAAKERAAAALAARRERIRLARLEAEAQARRDAESAAEAERQARIRLAALRRRKAAGALRVGALAFDAAPDGTGQFSATGVSLPNSHIALFLGDRQIGITEAGNDGGWAFNADLELDERVHGFRAEVVTGDGEMLAMVARRISVQHPIRLSALPARARRNVARATTPATGSAAETLSTDQVSTTPTRLAAWEQEFLSSRALPRQARASRLARAASASSSRRKERTATPVPRRRPRGRISDVGRMSLGIDAATIARPAKRSAVPGHKRRRLAAATSSRASSSRAKRRRHARTLRRAAKRKRRRARRSRRGKMPRYHKVRRGDTLWQIAARYYGNGACYRRLLRLNASKIRSAHMIYPNQRLRVR